ncbi:ester cyclase [Enterobacter ludwigii]|uniref:ester cyclase n=1 Tax=Enterobacter ludwigii TaxID=299767 RepID=UPI0034E90A95
MQYSTYARPAVLALILAGVSGVAYSAQSDRVKPNLLIVDNTLSQTQLTASEHAAVTYATFWDTGKESLAREALAVNFVDKTPPEGRKQGPEGAIMASRAFRTAVPDLRCEVEHMIVTVNRVVSHLHFHGHFSGTFGKIKGQGQNVDFIATDIYEIGNDKIVSNWHIEDNLTLMKQLGVI